MDNYLVSQIIMRISHDLDDFGFVIPSERSTFLFHPQHIIHDEKRRNENEYLVPIHEETQL